MIGPALQKLTWAACRERVQAVSQPLAGIIDALSPDKAMPLWLVSYPYGAQVDDGQFYYPLHEKLALLTDARLPKELKTDFSYAGLETPAGVMLRNSIELYIETPGRVIPHAVFMPGDVFALWKWLDPQPIVHPTPLMCGTAGARSIFMLPNISDVAAHKKLRQDFNIRHLAPKRLVDQWPLFTALVNRSAVAVSWRAEALLFPGIWLHRMKHDVAFQALYIHFLERAWRGSAYWRNKVFYDFIFSCVQQNRNLKPNPYLVDTVKHLITMAIGAVPGFGVAANDVTAPVDFIQQVYVESYGLKKYTPTLLSPAYFTAAVDSMPVYYSLQYPTTLEFSPRSRKLGNTLHDLGELKHILDVFLQEITRRKLKVAHGVIAKVADEVKFDFFHSKPDRYGDIRLTHTMPAEDASLTQCKLAHAATRFADTGAFVRGCVRMARGQEQEVDE